MGRPRSPETAEIIRMLGAKMSVQTVAERLDVHSGQVKDVYRKHYDEIVELQRTAERRAKAEELREMMAGKPKRKPKPVSAAAPEPVMEPAAAAAPEPVEEPAAAAAPEPVEEPAAVAAPEPVVEPAAIAAPEPVVEPAAVAALEPVEEPAAEAVPDPVEEPAAEATPEDAGASVPELDVEEGDKPVSGRLRVCGYLGDCGRVYSVLGRTVEISNLAPRFAKEDLRVLAHEMLDLVRILDRKEGLGA